MAVWLEAFMNEIRRKEEGCVAFGLQLSCGFRTRLIERKGTVHENLSELDFVDPNGSFPSQKYSGCLLLIGFFAPEFSIKLNLN
jgi:hypothetical protein